MHSGVTTMAHSSSPRRGTALVGFLAGILLVLCGFALGILADRELFSGSGAPAPVASNLAPTVPIPILPPIPTDTVPPGAPTSTPRPQPTQVPTVTPRPSDPAISVTPAQKTTPEQLRAQFDEFWQAFQLLEDHFYYRPIDEQQLVYGAIKGLYSAAGDENTFFLPPDAAKQRRDADNGQFVGIGVYLDSTKTDLTIASPIPNGPAAEAGIKAGDVIIAVDGQSITGIARDDQTTSLRGKEGTQVRLTIRRAGVPDFDVTLTRKVIVIPPVTLDIRPDGIGVLKITAFNDYTDDQLNAAFKRVRDEHLQGLVLDLRNNGGGHVDSALGLLGRFLPKDDLALLEDTRQTGGTLKPITVRVDGDQVLAIPLTVLVNGGTASASEIVAGALQDYGRATLVGVKTFGKGSEQGNYPFADGAMARITVTNWFTPRQRPIQKAGLMPDVVVEQPEGTTTDPQLAKAVEVLQGKIGVG
jgi:carboxyl-terminal processing protease